LCGARNVNGVVFDHEYSLYLHTAGREREFKPVVVPLPMDVADLLRVVVTELVQEALYAQQGRPAANPVGYTNIELRHRVFFKDFPS